MSMCMCMYVWCLHLRNRVELSPGFGAERRTANIDGRRLVGELLGVDVRSPP